MTPVSAQGGGKISKKESSFFEKKEAKKLYPDILAAGPRTRGKVFCFFFSKKKIFTFLFFPLPAWADTNRFGYPGSGPNGRASCKTPISSDGATEYGANSPLATLHAVSASSRIGVLQEDRKQKTFSPLASWRRPADQATRFVSRSLVCNA